MESRTLFAATVAGACLFLFSPPAQAQAKADDVPKFEIGVQFSSITKPDYNGGATEPGFGGRFTLNLNKSIALEAEGNFFPHKCGFCGVEGDNDGDIMQGLFGIKAGKRFQKWGLFAKARPGLVSFSQGDSKYVSLGNGNFSFSRNRLTHFAADVGAVLEFYPSKHLVTRFDGGDTIIHYGARTSNFLSFPTLTGPPVLVPFTISPATRHNFQFAAGVSWRF